MTSKRYIFELVSYYISRFISYILVFLLNILGKRKFGKLKILTIIYDYVPTLKGAATSEGSSFSCKSMERGISLIINKINKTFVQVNYLKCQL